jgi:RNA polymerase sigma-70 factor (ECF subfamily)
MEIMLSWRAFGPVLSTVPGREAAPVASSRVRMSSSGAVDWQVGRESVDTELMPRVAAGDRVAFSDLYDRFSRPLYGTALRILQDPAEAQDVVHDAFVNVWEKAATFESGRGTAFSWVLTSVRNRAIDRVRTRRRRSELLANAPEADVPHLATDTGPSGSDTAAAGDEARVVRETVGGLPPEQRRSLELAFFGGLTQEQIAAKLGEPLGTVKARIRRGLLKLRESLAPRS